MPVTDRLINHNDAVQIASLLEDISEQYNHILTVPTLINDGYIEYDGETHSVTEVLDGYDPDRMILTGDVEVNEEGKHSTSIQLKYVGDTWSDETTEVKIVNWKYGDPYLGITWANGTDEQIAEMIAAADRGEIDLTDYWDVGDTREVQLSAMSATGVGESHVAQTVELVLVAKDTGVQDSTNPCYNYQYTTATSGRTYPSFIVQQKNGLANGTSGEFGYMNSSNTNSGSWNGCARRTWCNNVYKAAIPSTLVNAFKQVKVKTIQTYNGSTMQESSDYFFLPAEKEVFGSKSYSNTTEANALSQWSYYSTSANRIKLQGSSGSAYYWWERSPNASSATAFCYVLASGGADYIGASYTFLLAPAGCI